MDIHKTAVIVPVVNVGTEDMLEVVENLPMGWIPVPFVYGTDRTLPLVRLKKLERLYFHFCEPIPTAQYGGDFYSEEYVQEVKDKAQAAIEKGIVMLRERRKLDYPDDDSTNDPQFPEKVSVAANLGKYIRSLVGSRL